MPLLFSGWPIVARKKAISALPSSWKEFRRVAGSIRVVTLSLALLYVAIGSVVSWDFIADSFQREIKSNSWLMVPLKWPQMVLPIGFTLYSLVLIMQIMVTIRNIQKRVEVKETGGEEF